MSGYGQPRDRGSWGLYGARLRSVDASRRVPLAAVEPGAPAPGSARQDMGVVEESIEQRGDGGGVAEELPPVLDRTIGSDQGGGSFIAAHDDLEKILGRGVRPAVHLFVEVEIEGVQPLVRVTEAGLLDAAGEQPVLAAQELIADESGEEVDRRQLSGLGFEQARL